MLPVDEVRIDPVEVKNIGLGKSIYKREQLDEFARFQDSQGTRKAYLAETAELAYRGRTGDGEWGLGLSSAAQNSIIDFVGAGFFPLYSVVGPMIFFVSLMLLVWGGIQVAGNSSNSSNNNCEMQRVWGMGADCFLGNLIPAGRHPLHLDGGGHGGSW
jgi:hypothetical protein